MPSQPDPRVGLTGARFGRVRRDAPEHEPSDVPEPSEPVPATERPAADPSAAYPAPYADREPRTANAPVERWASTSGDASEPASGQSPEPDRGHDPDLYSAPTVRVRPYVHTGGRTGTHTPLPIEALVCAVPCSSSARLHGTHQSVLQLCRVPQSVAEVSAQLGVPLAVARVLVDDLVAEQVVTVQRGVDENTPDVALMRRVLTGLHQL